MGFLSDTSTYMLTRSRWVDIKHPTTDNSDLVNFLRGRDCTKVSPVDQVVCCLLC